MTGSSSRSSACVLAFDLGGTRLKAGVVDRASGRVEHHSMTASPPDADGALAELERVGKSLLAADPCVAVGLAVPGLVDLDGRIVALPGKLEGIVGLDLAGWLRGRFELPSIVSNDAIAYGVGEANRGAGRGHERVVVVTIGTGVGCAVLQHGTPITTGTLGGGLLGGQIPIADDRSGPRDTNGKRGTIEALCAAHRIVDHAGAGGGRLDSVEAVYAAADAHDEIAVSALTAYRRDLARGLAALAHAHTPSILVLGGGPMVPANPVMAGLETLVHRHLWPGYRPEIALARLGEDAALVGLAHLAAAGSAA